MSDERTEVGGKDEGPAPHEFLCAALGAGTAITLRMSAQRKEWSLRAVHVDLALTVQVTESSITRRLRLEGDLDETERARLADIAERTPVTLILKHAISIMTIPV
jgi:putative redox protein